MNAGKEYAELLKQRKSSAFLKPLLGVWEFIPKPFDYLPNAQEKDLFQLENIQRWYNWQLLVNLKKEILSGKAIIVTDVMQHIQYVSSHFQVMTEYTVKETLGRRPSFLQGKNTSSETLSSIRQALFERSAIKTSIVNYKKSGAAYLCEVEIFPIFQSSGELSHFMAIEQEIEHI